MRTNSGKEIREYLRVQWPLLILGVLVILFIAYFVWYTFSIVDRYQTGGFDLAVYAQTVWNTIQGNWFRSTYEPGWEILLADHFEPILLPISLLYLLWPNPKMLLLLQTVALALGAFPVYWLARDGLRAVLSGNSSPGEGETAQPASPAAELLVKLSALAFAVIYLLYPPFQSAVYYEFHPSALAIPFLLFALYFMRLRRAGLFFVFILLAMSTKETLPLVTLGVGLYLLVIRREWVLGTVTVLVSAVWFVVGVFVVIPHFSPGGKSLYFTSEYYDWLGDSSGEIVLRLITHPGLLVERLFSQLSTEYLVGILGPMAFVSVLGLPVLLLALPPLALNALSDVTLQYSMGSYFHYAAPLVPFVIVAAIDGTAFLTRHLGRSAQRIWPANRRLTDPRPIVLVLVMVLILVASVVAHLRQGYLPFGGRFFLLPESEQVAAIDALIEEVPPEASLSTDRHPAPKLSQREDLYLYPDQPEGEYQLIDVGYPDWTYHPRDRYEEIQSLLQAGQYGVRDGRYRHLLLEQGLNQTEIPAPFYDFARADNPSPQYKMEVDFGDDLRLLGFDFSWERPFYPRAYLVLYWQALRPIDRDLRLFTIRTNPAGELLPATELEFVESVWYPPSRWEPSEVMRTETFHWYTHRQSAQFGVAIGAVEGPGIWDINKRLRPEVRAVPWETPLLHGDTLLWLGMVKIADQHATFEPPQEVQ
jgi:uncharacterized membrane protein